MLRGMDIESVPCLTDNYAYLLLDGTGGAVVVDPSEAPPVEEALGRLDLRPTAIWLTHHHFDHVGGVEALYAAYGPLPVIGSEYDLAHGRIPQQTRGVGEGDTLDFAGWPVRVLEIPGHTLGAVAYLVDGCLFSGDTLFVAGCGRVFEGTLPMMQHSLAKLRALPDDTQLYCGHEYTEANLRFAASVEPGAAAVARRAAWAAQQRTAGKPTVPSRLSDERATNPFLRWDAADVIAFARGRGAGSEAPADVFAAVRQAKDVFKS
jgi:hydroxyacylglutathione hydrolase